MIEINIGGKKFSSFEEMAECLKHDNDSNTLIWDYMNVTTIENGRPVGHGRGKCWLHGKCYEGEIEYKDGGLYVGGEFVREEPKYSPKRM